MKKENIIKKIEGSNLSEEEKKEISDSPQTHLIFLVY